MTQQIFSVIKEKGSESLISRSIFGTDSWHEAVAIQPGTALEFLIFHGVDGTNLGFSVGARLAKKRDYIQYNKTHNQTKKKSVADVIKPDVLANSSLQKVQGSKIDANKSFKTKIPSGISEDFGNESPRNITQLRVDGNIWPGDNWGPGSFYDDGWEVNPDPPFPSGGGGGGGGYPQASFNVQLFRPNETEPIKEWNVDAENGAKYRPFKFPNVGPDTGFPDPAIMKKYGWWKCVVTLTGEEPAFMQFRSTSFLKKTQIKEKVFPRRWLEHAFWNVLNVLTPQVSIAGDTLVVSLAKELEHSVGITPISFTLRDDRINSHAQLTSVQTQAVQGKDVHIFLKGRRDIANRLYIAESKRIISGESDGARQSRISIKENTYEKAKSRYESSLKDFNVNQAVLQIIPVFINPKVDISYGPFGGSIEFDAVPSIFIGFRDPNFYNKLIVYSEIDYKIKDINLLDGIALSIYELWKDVDVDTYVNNKIEEVIEEQKNSELIQEYLYLALGKATSQTAIVEDLTANAQGWVVKYYEPIAHPDPAVNFFVKPDLVNETTSEIEGTKILASRTGLASDSIAIEIDIDAVKEKDRPTPLPRFRDKDIPKTFKLGNAVSLKKLEKVDTIIVLMMENRSFDHFLGDLKRVFPNKGYRGFDLDFTNPAAGNFKDPIPVCKASNAFFPSATVTPISPEHSHYHVMRQIGDGSYNTKKPKSENDHSTLGLMQGFTKDILARFSENAGNIKYPHEAPRYESPQVVMTYYQEEQLPTYYHFARNFKVLDQWFAAHPGATWPNRIATHTGKLVSLENFPLDDTRLGYLTDKTIFDVLTENQIDWKFLESNVSIMRLFDKYRTDDTHVIPLHRGPVITNHKFEINDQDFAEFDALLAKNKLPRVLFIEPRFSDAPPLGLATDDLAPADISNGQAFVKTIYEKLLNSPHWGKAAMLITYDEHGGFFDHVAPPGTPHSEYPNPVPPIYVDPKDPENPEKWGPTHMGVRVPTFLISPFVNAHSVGHTVFDHTSILKSILVHNRANIPPRVLASFGERVNQANHIGMELDTQIGRDLTGLRSKIRNLKIWDKVRYRRSRITNIYRRFDGIDKQDYHECLRTMFMP